MLLNSNTSHTNKSIFNLYYFRYVLKHLSLPVLHKYFCSLSYWMLVCVAHLDARSSQTCRWIMRCSWRQQRMPGNLAWSGTMSLTIQRPRNLRFSCPFTPSRLEPYAYFRWPYFAVQRKHVVVARCSAMIESFITSLLSLIWRRNGAIDCCLGAHSVMCSLIFLQELFRKVRSILNKLTPQMFNQLIKQVTDLTINTEERLKGVIDLVFEKAIDEPSFSVAYGNMCSCLATVRVTFH